jgi:hypothetical protein
MAAEVAIRAETNFSDSLLTRNQLKDASRDSVLCIPNLCFPVAGSGATARRVTACRMPACRIPACRRKFLAMAPA